MALTPTDEIHALQIQAGTLGRKAGHAFEDKITDLINNISYPITFAGYLDTHLHVGNPAHLLLHYIASVFKIGTIDSAVALSTGALATTEDGKKWLEVNGVKVKKCKSDLILTLKFSSEKTTRTIGISTKQCNNKNPTNAQLFFTTARSFAGLLNNNHIPVSGAAILSLRQFCGDKGFRPLDAPDVMEGRVSDPRRYFWEEINTAGREEWERIFADKQDDITKLLIQKAYLDDPFSPDIILHKTKKACSWEATEVAIYTVDEIILHSRNYSSFALRPYSVRKGSYKDPAGVKHMAPRFGIVQMQRGGQTQHPNQLQFNLQAGYFYKIQNVRSNMLSDSFGE